MVKSELQILSSRRLEFPTLAEIETANLSIWLDDKPNLGLLPGPDALTKGTSFWKLGSNFVLGSAYVISILMKTSMYLAYSRFGAYMSRDQSPRMDCLLLVLVDLRCQS